MMRDEVEMTGSSSGGPAMAVPTLHPLVIRSLASGAANEQEPSWVEADPAGWDAPISVWWDYPPAGDT